MEDLGQENPTRWVRWKLLGDRQLHREVAAFVGSVFWSTKFGMNLIQLLFFLREVPDTVQGMEYERSELTSNALSNLER